MEFPEDAQQCANLVLETEPQAPDVQYDGKKLARRHSNKLAAAKSRQRKNEEMKRIMDDNAALKREIEMLKAQIAEWRARIANGATHDAPPPTSAEPAVDPQPAPPKKRGRK
jgi:succinate dehydrogenase/fumarate reductase flavoprotein subunit